MRREDEGGGRGRGGVRDKDTSKAELALKMSKSEEFREKLRSHNTS